jgi:hypothetical protein
MRAEYEQQLVSRNVSAEMHSSELTDLMRKKSVLADDISQSDTLIAKLQADLAILEKEFDALQEEEKAEMQQPPDETLYF